MQMTIYTADCTGNERNCIYPNRHDVDDESSFMGALERDHVLAKYKNSYRSNDNFIESDCIVMDCDNDGADEPITMQEFADSIPDVCVGIAPSRHNLLPKGNKPAVERFHAYFPIRKITDQKKYVALKNEILATFPFFDAGAKDAARFIYGSPMNMVIWQEGDMTIDEVLEERVEAVIPEGRRNSTMSRFAGRVLIRFGECDRAKEVFMERAAKCDPPLGEDELKTIWSSALRFYGKIKSQKDYVPPDQYDFMERSLCPDDFSDIGQAKVIEREYGDELKYTDATDMLRFDGISWVESKQKAIGAVIEFLDLQYADACMAVDKAAEEVKDAGIDVSKLEGGGKKYLATLSDAQLKVCQRYMFAKSYRAFVLKRRDMKFVTSAIGALKPMVEIGVDELDADPFLLNTPTMTIDLRTGDAREHRSEDYITKVTAVDPSDEGKDLWLDALDAFFLYDQELIDYVQQISSLGIIGRVFLEIMIIAWGTGSNGKSTYWNSIQRVLGSYCGNMASDALTVGCKRNTQYELAEAKGQRLIIAAELEEGQRLNTSFVKQMSSTDKIFCQKKYKNPFSYIPSHTLVCYTNFLPRVSACDNGTWRRLVVIPFNAVIKGNDDIKNYTEYLVENAGGYILKWLIEGAEKLINNDFRITPPGVVTNAIEKYKGDNDWIGHFIEDCCELDQTYTERSGDLYQEYRMYASRTGEFVRSTTDFYSAIDGMGLKRKKTKQGVKVYGIRLKSEDFGD